MSAKLQSYVFVSYVREDAEQVERLANDLRKHGIEVWLDKNDILPGQDWKIAINDAIRKGAFFIACFSDAYAKKGESYVHEELKLAIERLRQMPDDRLWFLPVRLSDCEVPEKLIYAGKSIRDLYWTDLFSSYWKPGIAQILKVIGRVTSSYSTGLAGLEKAIAKLSLLSEGYRQREWRDIEGANPEQVKEFKNNYFAVHKQVVDFFMKLKCGSFSLDELAHFSKIHDRMLLEHELSQRRLEIRKMRDFYQEIASLPDEIRSMPIFNLQRALEYGRSLVSREVNKDGLVTADTIRRIQAQQQDSELEYVHGIWFLTKLFAKQELPRIGTATKDADSLEASFEKPSPDEKATLAAFIRNEDQKYNTRAYEIAYQNWLHGAS